MAHHQSPQSSFKGRGMPMNYNPGVNGMNNNYNNVPDISQPSRTNQTLEEVEDEGYSIYDTAKQQPNLKKATLAAAPPAPATYNGGVESDATGASPKEKGRDYDGGSVGGRSVGRSVNRSPARSKGSIYGR